LWYFQGLIAAALLCAAVPAPAADERSAAEETKLIETLRTAAKPEKAMACKKLAIHGSKAAVPELAKLLADKELASWARIALEAIPDEAAGEALRGALDDLEGLLLVGTINSIGVRKDAESVAALTQRLKADDAEVASAAAVALGHIAGDSATKALREQLDAATAGVRNAVAEGCILCAERLLADGKADEAAALYDAVRKAEVPRQKKLEATRGSIVARQAGGIPLLVEQLKSEDKRFFQLALSVARELRGTDVSEQLAEHVRELPAERGALLLVALGDRTGGGVPKAVLAAAQEGPTAVRVAAVGVIGRLGDAKAVPTLLKLAEEENSEVAEAAKAALESLPGDDASQAIAALLTKAEGKSLPIILTAIGQRRISAAGPVVKLIDQSDAAVRNAALSALGEIAGPEQFEVLIAQVVSPKYSVSSEVALRALRAAAVRMPDREAAATKLAAAIQQAPLATKVQLLEILGAMGGHKALATIAEAARGREEQLQDVGSRVLGEWMSADAAPALMDLAKSSAGGKYRVRALRGYLRLARQFGMPDQQRIEMAANALAVATRPEERKLALEILERYPSVQSLKVARAAAQNPESASEAGRVAAAIAKKIGGESSQRDK
jgi:HEAT repeat protein